MTHPRVLRLAQNTKGRDFVLGDIHGAYDLVVAAMKAVTFDDGVDRILSVGDLVDRGSGSARVLKFLSKNYVFAVMGNHDDDFHQLDHGSIQALAGVNWNGMGWAKGLSEPEVTAIQQKLAALPIAMEVPSPRGLVGLVHGDVPKGLSWQEFTRRLEANDPAVIACALTSRDRVQSRDDSGVEGIGRVFVGHTVCWEGPRRMGNVYAVDTGAVFAEISADKPSDELRGYLTMTNICAHSQSLSRVATPAESQTRLILNHEAEETPFSTYAQARPRAA